MDHKGDLALGGTVAGVVVGIAFFFVVVVVVVVIIALSSSSSSSLLFFFFVVVVVVLVLADVEIEIVFGLAQKLRQLRLGGADVAVGHAHHVGDDPGVRVWPQRAEVPEGGGKVRPCGRERDFGNDGSMEKGERRERERNEREREREKLKKRSHDIPEPFARALRRPTTPLTRPHDEPGPAHVVAEGGVPCG